MATSQTTASAPLVPNRPRGARVGRLLGGALLVGVAFALGVGANAAVVFAQRNVSADHKLRGVVGP